MIISNKKILELNKKYKIIENLSERESKQPEGVGIDVRIGEAYKLEGEGYLGVTERKTPEVKKIADIKRGDKEIILKPGELIVVRTIEKVNLPAKKIVIEKGEKPAIIMLDAYPRGTLQHCGIAFLASKGDPGYSGQLKFTLVNVGNCTFRLELGARIANLIFHSVTGEIHRAYEGQWKGGRVTTPKKEKQN
jgi:deoxycytidine triphosphate deaminase